MNEPRRVVLEAEGPAKLNLGLVVRPPDASGLHPIVSFVTTVDLVDALVLEVGRDVADGRTVEGPFAAEIAEIGERDLAWQAVERIRHEARRRPQVALRIDKRIPAGSGLGGASADAAAVLVALGPRWGVEEERLRSVATALGADVPYLLRGGPAWMTGHGEMVEPVVADLADHAYGIVVPPFRLDTGAVYRRWDELDGPEGPSIEERAVPPSLRPYGPFRNDLLPAAVAVVPELADWIAELEAAWDRPVAMTGSGSGLFAWFLDRDEAADAVAHAPAVARLRVAATARPVGTTSRVQASPPR